MAIQLVHNGVPNALWHGGVTCHCNVNTKNNVWFLIGGVEFVDPTFGSGQPFQLNFPVWLLPLLTCIWWLRPLDRIILTIYCAMVGSSRDQEMSLEGSIILFFSSLSYTPFPSPLFTHSKSGWKKEWKILWKCLKKTKLIAVYFTKDVVLLDLPRRSPLVSY